MKSITFVCIGQLPDTHSIAKNDERLHQLAHNPLLFPAFLAVNCPQSPRVKIVTSTIRRDFLLLGRCDNGTH